MSAAKRRAFRQEQAEHRHRLQCEQEELELLHAPESCPHCNEEYARKQSGIIEKVKP
jgi:hypothetical protein